MYYRNECITLVPQIDAFHTCLHLLVLDSVTLLLAPLLGGQQSEGEPKTVYLMVNHAFPLGHSLMCQLAYALRILAQEHSVAIVVSDSYG